MNRMSELVTLKIEGMTCASCVARVEKSLLKVPGVEAASINLATEKAQIRLGESTVALPSLIAAVESAGFGASLAQKFNNQTPPKSILSLQGGLAVALAMALSLPLMLPMLMMTVGVHWMLPAWVQFLLATPVQFVLGSRFYVAGWKALRNGSGNMDLLVAIGTSAAYGLSLYQWYLSDWGSAFEAHELYFESSAIVIALVMLGKWLESRAKKETTQAITALQALWPDQVKLLIKRDMAQLDFTETSISQILPNDWVLVLPGERLPVDGIVLEGQSEVDESMLTGESRLINKSVDSLVTGGSMNGSGRLIIRATGVGEDSTLAKLIQMVENAQAKKAPIQRAVDQISAWFVPVVLGIAFLNFLVHFFVLNQFEHALLYSVAILVIACPCALGLATPVAIMAGTGVAAKLGILIKDAEALELAHKLKVIAFDKTGTLTQGKPKVVSFQNLTSSSNQSTDAELLGLAVGLQLGSEHPLAKAMVEYGQAHQAEAEKFSSVSAQVGQGVKGTCLSGAYQGCEIGFISWHALQASMTPTDFESIQQWAQPYLQKGQSVSCLVNFSKKNSRESNSVDGFLLALLAFGDELKPGVKDMIGRLKAMNIKTVMISGDHQVVADVIAQQIGIDEVYAQVLPADKANLIQKLRTQALTPQREKSNDHNQFVAMVGDGINDAPALAAADVGIAMSTGSDIAMHTAGITLMRGDPGLVPDAIEISKKTWQKIQQNLFWAFIYNLVGIPLAAMGYLSPMLAGAAMAASSVSVVGNALLLKKWSRHT